MKVFLGKREKIGIMFGSPETTTGGRALKFYASVRLDVRRVDSIKNGDKRAAITGTYAGKAAVDETAKRYHRTLGGYIIEEPEQN